MRGKKIKIKNIYISFVEEAVLNPNYYGYIGGRIEISYPGDHFPLEEIRFFTKNIDNFYKFREQWDMKKITIKQLQYIKHKIERHFSYK